MDCKRTFSAIALSLGLVFAPGVFAAQELRVISDRTPSHLEPLFKHYQETTGIKIEAVFVEKGLIARLQSRPTEADVVITNSADILEEAKQNGLLQSYASEKINSAVKPEYRDPESAYLTQSYRPRAIFASKSRVKPGEVKSYADLIDSKWLGRVCIRSGYDQYNLNFFSQIAVDKGLGYARSFLTGLKKNLARAPSGNDRAQARGIYEGVCDLAVANSYYMPIMLSSEEQRPWGESAYVIFPDQEAGGSYILRGGSALTKADGNVAEATKLLEFLVSDEAQNFIVNSTYEYPISGTVTMPEANKQLGKEQPGITEGRFKAKVIPLADIAAIRPEIVKILDEINFDGK